jgi:hypothetical protein
MTDNEELWRLEEMLWTSGRESARVNTASDGIVVMPYPSGILQGEGIWSDPKVNTGWRLVELADRSATRRGDVAVLAYRVRAEKPGVPIHEALCTSTWLNDAGTWHRLVHHQSPVDTPPRA